MLIVLLGFALLASAITANKLLLVSLPPLMLVGIRMLGAGIILLWITHKRGVSRFPFFINDLIPLIFIMLFTTFIPSWCKAYALKLLPSWKAAFIGSLDPFVTALYSYMLWSERLSFNKCIGILLGFLGSLLICFPSTFEWNQFIAVATPELVAFTAVAIGRYGWIMAQRLLKAHRYNPAELNGIIMTGSGLVALPLSWQIESSAWQISFFTEPSILAMIAYTTIIGNVIAYTMYAHNLKRYSVNFVSLAGFSTPLFVSFYGWLILKEQLTGMFFIATVLTFIGVILFYADEISKWNNA